MNHPPDFIIIGAMKCATSTLHKQLSLQMGISMSDPKEPNFFSNDEVYERGIQWYESCFSKQSGTALLGESSTHYTKLPTYPRTVGRILKHAPDCRFIYIMRHPIDRLVSHYIHDWSEQLVSYRIDEAIDRHPTLIEYGRYTMQLAPYIDAFGFDRILPIFFDRFNTRSQLELERICRFVGYFERRPCWNEDAQNMNVSAARMKKNRLRDAIVFAPGISAIRSHLVPRSWRDRVKRLWTMRERPRLVEATESRLRDIFDEDLARLGSWLGISLSCNTFKQATTDGDPPSWHCASQHHNIRMDCV